MEKKKRNGAYVSLICVFQMCVMGLVQCSLGATETNSKQFDEQTTLSEKTTKSDTVNVDELLAYNDSGCVTYGDPCCPAPECPQDECCEKVEYVDFLPSEEGVDAGLYCLPGSTCNLSCPTKPDGGRIFARQGRLGHRYRYGSFYTPGQWVPIMMHMRYLVPMSACDYRKVLHFLQEKPHKRKLSAYEIAEAATSNSTDLAATDSSGQAEDELIAAADGTAAEAEEELSLEEVVGDIDAGDFDFADGGAFGAGSWIPKYNHVLCGLGFLEYQVPIFSFFGDLDGQRSFFYLFAGRYLASYGDHLFSYISLGLTTFGQDGVALPFGAFVSYFFNDYLTFSFGQQVLGFGGYWNHNFGVCEKVGSFPLIRDFYLGGEIVPNTAIGVQLSGALPLCCLGECFNRAKITYNITAFNGPSEYIQPTLFGGDKPFGSIVITDTQQPNCNNDNFYSGRIGFMPNDCAIFGVSYMRGRWNADAKSFGFDPSHHLYFQAAALDWTMNLNPYIGLAGEWIWTQYENSHAVELPTAFGPVPSPMLDHPWVRNVGYWAQVSIELGILSCLCPNLYWCKPCLWDSLELVFRSGGVWRQTAGIVSPFFQTGGFGFDYSGFDRRRFTICLGYYFTQTFSIKLNYDINYGKKALNFFRQAVTGSSEKTGFAQNVFTLRLVMGW